MKNGSFEQLVNGAAQLIVQQKINGIKNNIKGQLQIIQQWHISKQCMLELELISIFEKLNGKKPETKKNMTNSTKLNFKLLLNENNTILASQIWQLHWNEITVNNKIMYPDQILTPVKSFISNIIEVSSIIPSWRAFIGNKNKKNSNCYITYQILHDFKLNISSYGLNKVQMQTNLLGKKLSCTVYHTTAKVLNNIQNIISSLMVLRKGSVSTMITSSLHEGQPQSKKVSIYSYYDPQSQVTFLSNDEFQLDTTEGQIQSITFQQNKDQQQEYQMILIQEDQKMYKFKSFLKEIQKTVQQPFFNTTS